MAKARDEEGSAGPLLGATSDDLTSHGALIKGASQAVNDAVARLYATVQSAREHGESWTAIGAALGITRQAAHERFGRGDPRPFRIRRR